MSKRPTLPKTLQAVCAVSLLALACVFFVEAGGPEPFILAQPLAAAAIAFVIVTSTCWDWELFGDPRRVTNLVGHVAFFFALLFLISSLYSPHGQTVSLLDAVARTGSLLAGWLAGIPPAVFDVIRAPSIAFFFLVVCLALALPRRDLAIGVLFTACVAEVLWGLNNGSVGHIGYTLAGLVLLLSGLALLRDDPSDARFAKLLRERLKGDAAYQGDLELKLRLLQRMRHGDGTLSERQCLGAIARALRTEADAPETREVTARIVGQLIEQDHLALVMQTAGGKSLVLPDEAAHGPEASPWRAIAGVPKAIAIALLVLIWIVSPIDLIPDNTPFFGTMDDAAAAVIGACVIYRSLLPGRREGDADLLSMLTRRRRK